MWFVLKYLVWATCSYWNYNRPEDVGIQGRADIPTLNMMGFEDEYFGVHNSVAATVASYGDHPPISGHAFEAMLDRGIQWGLVRSPPSLPRSSF